MSVGQSLEVTDIFYFAFRADEAYRWIATDEQLVTTDHSGKISAHKPGKARIQLTTESGQTVAEIEVEVKPSEMNRVVTTLTGKSGFNYNPATIVDNEIYQGTSIPFYKEVTDANAFYKLDLDLKKIWEYPLGKTLVRGSASLDSRGNIYFVAEDGIPITEPRKYDDYYEKSRLRATHDITHHLYSLTNSGEFRWKHKISHDDLDYTMGMFGVAVSADDLIYVGDSKFYAFNTDGRLIWSYPVNGSVVARHLPTIDPAGNIYFSATNFNPADRHKIESEVTVYKFRPGTDRPLWTTRLERGEASMTPTLNYQSRRIYTNVGRKLYSINIDDGKVIWSKELGQPTATIRANPVIDQTGNLFIGTKDNNDSIFYALRNDGQVIWEKLIGADIYCSAMLGDDGLVYFGSEGSYLGAFYAMDKSTGEIKWTLPYIENRFYGLGWASVRLHNGFAYISGEEFLHKIRLDAHEYLPDAVWPTFRGNNLNNGRI